MALKYFLFAITNDADAVVLVAAPELQELSRQSVWPHSGTRHQHARHGMTSFKFNSEMFCV
jgi:hypothetical protein